MAEDQGPMASKEIPTSDKVNFYLAVGDRYQQSEQWKEALKNFEEALTLAPFDVRIHRRIVALYFPWWTAHIHGRSNDTDAIFNMREKAKDSLYKIKALDPEAKKDKEVVDWEYQFFVKQVSPFRRNTNPKKADIEIAEEILRRKNALEPANPEVLSKLGLTRANLAKYFGGQDTGLEYIKQAIRLDPNNSEYRATLAEALAMHNLRTEAIQEYVAAIQVIEGEDYHAKVQRSHLAEEAIELFTDAAKTEVEGKFEVWPKFSSIAMSQEEKIKTLKYLIDLHQSKVWSYRTGSGMIIAGGRHILPIKWLGGLMFDAQDYQSADQMFFSQKEALPYAMDEEVYERWIEALEKGGHNPARLAEVRQEYEEKFGEASISPKKKYRR
jgi:tetratricopeptide (TPR) repeat protein